MSRKKRANCLPMKAQYASPEQEKYRSCLQWSLSYLGEHPSRRNRRQVFNRSRSGFGGVSHIFCLHV